MTTAARFSPETRGHLRFVGCALVALLIVATFVVQLTAGGTDLIRQWAEL